MTIEVVHNNAPENARVAALEERLKESQQETIELKKKDAIVRQAGRFNDPQNAYQLLRDQLKYNSSNRQFEAMGADGEPRTVRDLISELEVCSPWLLKPVSDPNAAQSAPTEADKAAFIKTIFGPESNSKAANALYKRNLNEYKQLKQIAKSMGLVA